MGRFGSPLGLENIVVSFVFKAFREHSLFSNNIVSRAVLNRTWFQKPAKMTSQNDPKTNKHATKTSIKKRPKQIEQIKHKSEKRRPLANKLSSKRTESATGCSWALLCTALVTFSFSFRPPAWLCTALVIFSFFFRPLTSLCTALVIFSFSFRTSWGPLGSLFAALGALGP